MVGVVRSRTKHPSSQSKHAICLKLGLGRAYQIYIKLDFHNKSHMEGFLKSGALKAVITQEH